MVDRIAELITNFRVPRIFATLPQSALFFRAIEISSKNTLYI